MMATGTAYQERTTQHHGLTVCPAKPPIVWMVDLCASTKARFPLCESVQSVGPAQPLNDGLDVSKVDRVGVVVLHEQPRIGRDAHLSVVPVSLRGQGSRTSIQPLLHSNGGIRCSILYQFGQLLVAEEEIVSELRAQNIAITNNGFQKCELTAAMDSTEGVYPD